MKSEDIKEIKEKPASVDVSETNFVIEAKATGKKLETDEKVEIIIPINPLNEKDLIVPVTINGYQYNIKRGVAVKVPKSVKLILKDAGYLS